MTLLADQPVSISDPALTSARYVSFDLQFEGDHQGQICLDCFTEGEEQARCRFTIGLIPGLMARLAIDLRHTQGQQVNIARTPGRLRCKFTGDGSTHNTYNAL